MRKPADSSSKTTSAAPTFMGATLKIIKNACCVFSGCALALILLHWMMSGTLDNALIAADVFLLLYPLSLCIAVAHGVRKSERIPLGGKCVLHPILCLGGVFLVYLPYMIRNQFRAGTVMVHLFAFAVAYGLVMAGIYLASLIANRKGGRGSRAKAAADSAYTPVFSKKDEEK